MKIELMFDYREEVRKDSSGKPLTMKDKLQGDQCCCVRAEFNYKNTLSFKSISWEIVDAFIYFEHDKKKNDNCFRFAQMTGG